MLEMRDISQILARWLVDMILARTDEGYPDWDNPKARSDVWSDWSKEIVDDAMKLADQIYLQESK